jgi:hypothetical protein
VCYTQWPCRAIYLISTIYIYDKLVIGKGKIENKSIFNVHHVVVVKEKKIRIFQKNL